MENYNVQEKVSNQNKSSNNQDVGAVQLKQNNMSDIIQRAKINPNIMTQNDAMVLQRKIGNGGLMQLFKEQGEMQEDTVEENHEISEAEGPLQMKKNDTIQRAELAENKTGMPDNLKAGVENLSGLDMSDVRVHYNSDKPAKVGALAYTQGSEIHVGPGQEEHLAHEAWHVVQQAQGRVQPTMQMKGINVNDDVRLEEEANLMGKKALQMKNTEAIHKDEVYSIQCKFQSNTVQRMDPIDIIFENASWNPTGPEVDTKNHNTEHFKNVFESFVKENSPISLAKLMTIIPSNSVNNWKPEKRIKRGFKFNFKDSDGQEWTVRGHEPELSAADPNKRGTLFWTVRINYGSIYLLSEAVQIDLTGTQFSQYVNNPKSDTRVNLSHIVATHDYSSPIFDSI